jgi:hypothetical protein
MFGWKGGWVEGWMDMKITLSYIRAGTTFRTTET